MTAIGDAGAALATSAMQQARREVTNELLMLMCPDLDGTDATVSDLIVAYAAAIGGWARALEQQTSLPPDVTVRAIAIIALSHIKTIERRRVQ